jgi:p38 MAP kinase
MKVTGTPPAEFVQKLHSAEVSGQLGEQAGNGPGSWPSPSSLQAKNYMKGLPELEKKDFASVLTNASPMGRPGGWKSQATGTLGLSLV